MYPDKPRCHDKIRLGIEWQNRDDGWRHCGYCGSLHPQDFLKAVTEQGATLELADMKYGWPHKVYVRETDGGQCKFYTEHLLDLEGQPEFEAIAMVIADRTGIVFFMRDGKLWYRTQCFENE